MQTPKAAQAVASHPAGSLVHCCWPKVAGGYGTQRFIATLARCRALPQSGPGIYVKSKAVHVNAGHRPGMARSKHGFRRKLPTLVHYAHRESSGRLSPMLSSQPQDCRALLLGVGRPALTPTRQYKYAVLLCAVWVLKLNFSKIREAVTLLREGQGHGRVLQDQIFLSRGQRRLEKLRDGPSVYRTTLLFPAPSTAQIRLPRWCTMRYGCV